MGREGSAWLCVPSAEKPGLSRAVVVDDQWVTRTVPTALWRVTHSHEEGQGDTALAPRAFAAYEAADLNYGWRFEAAAS